MSPLRRVINAARVDWARGQPGSPVEPASGPTPSARTLPGGTGARWIDPRFPDERRAGDDSLAWVAEVVTGVFCAFILAIMCAVGLMVLMVPFSLGGSDGPDYGPCPVLGTHWTCEFENGNLNHSVPPHFNG